MSETDLLAQVDLPTLYSNRQMRMAPRHVYGTRHPWAYMLPRPTLRHVGYTRDDEEPLPPRFYTESLGRPASWPHVQSTPPSYVASAHPSHPNAHAVPYEADGQYNEALPYEREMVHTHMEGTPSPILSRMPPPLAPIHVDEAKLYRTTHKSSTIAYHLPSGTRQVQRRREENVDFWDSLS